MSDQNPLTGEDVGAGGRAIALAGLITTLAGGQIRAARKTIARLTEHFVDKAINRGVKPGQILDALKNPIKVNGVTIDAHGRPGQKIVGRQATVIQNPETGNLVTTYPTSSRTRDRILRDKPQE